VGGGNTFGTEDFIQVQAFTSEVDTYSRIDMGIGEFEWTLIDAPSPELAAGTAAWTDLEINRGERGTDGGAGAVDTVTITINC
jgi:hypothetical protein